MTFTLYKSALFQRQWQQYAQEYKDKAGLVTAERFIAAVEEALAFLRHSANGCPLYDLTGFPNLRHHAYRKWNLHGFPHAVFFRVAEDRAVYVDVLYPLRMDIPARLVGDVIKES